ncbi:MAG: hypothetical protein NBV60_05975 [Erythrobacter sp.]|nr:hypothetical protein [Erythrobacter sp.]
MKTIAWLVGGFMLLGLSGMIEAVGDSGATAADRLPIYLFALAVLLGAPFCFYKAIRRAFAGTRSRKPAPSAPESPRAAHRIVDGPAPAESGEFDPDAAFARYMEKRASQPSDTQLGEAAPPSPQPPRPSFGRKVV